MTEAAPLVPPSAAQIDALRVILRRAAEQSPLYAELFAAHGITATLVAGAPLAALARLPLFDPAWLGRLEDETLRTRRFDLGGIELTSGTSGAPKRRVLSEMDVRRDAALVTRLLCLAGVCATDRVAAIEPAVEPLNLAFLEGCERLGVRESVAVALGPSLDVEPLRRLRPSVLLAAPSVLTPLAPILTAAERSFTPRLIIYNGDRLPARTASALRASGIGLRSLYGLTETSALGAECWAEDGIHLDEAHALAESRAPRRPAELIITMLDTDMPLLRYPTGDLVQPVRQPCPCGACGPRVLILQRTDAQFSLHEVKLNPEELHALLLEGGDQPMQIVLDQTPAGGDRMTIHLPEEQRPRRAALHRRLVQHPSLDYLVRAGLLQPRLRFHPLPVSGRKLPLVIDRRGRDD